jgi:hypothetical protein
MRETRRNILNTIKEIGLVPTLQFAIEAQKVVLNRWLVVVGSLLFIAGVSLVIAKKGPLYGIIVAILPLAAAFLLFLANHLSYAPVVILFSAAYIPFSLPTGTGSRLVISLVFSLALVLLWLFRMVVIEKNVVFVRTPANLPVFGFVAASIFSLLWSTIFRDPLLYVPQSFIFVQAASLSIMVISPLLLLFMANVASDVRILKVMTWVMISVGFFGLVDNFLNGVIPVNTQGLTSMWVIGLIVALILFDRSLSVPIRVSLGLIALLWVYWGFVTNLSWVAGWLPGFVAGFVILFFRSKKLLLAGCVVVLLYVVLRFSVFQSWLGQETIISGDTRVSAWEMNWKFTSQHLLFGMGPAGYAVYYMTYYPTNAMATHSNYIDVFSETGVVGTVFYVAIFAVLIWRGVVVFQRVKGRGDFIEALVAAALGGTVGCIVIMAFGDWLLPFAYTQTISGFSYTVYSWLFMGTILSLDTLTGCEASMLEGAGQ